MKKTLIFLALFLLVISCGDKPRERPSEIYFGEDICQRCKMIISEKKFASQYRLLSGETLKFDDLGCMIHYMHNDEKSEIESIYVTDYESGTWVDADKAYLIWTDSLNTPMSYGIVAFENIEQAKEVSEKRKGKDLGDLKSASKFLLNTPKNTSDKGVHNGMHQSE